MASTHSELEGDELDLTGLVESIVDSDEDDDLVESIDVSKNRKIETKISKIMRNKFENELKCFITLNVLL